MIHAKINISNFDSTYNIGIFQGKLDLKGLMEDKNETDINKVLGLIIKLTEKIQERFPGSIIQFMSHKFILNQKHIITACYHALKAFIKKISISNKRNMEILLYLAANRQIKKALDIYGLNLTILREGTLTCCIISPKNNIAEINQELLEGLKIQEYEPDINDITIEKYSQIKKIFKFSDDQIDVILNSYDIKEVDGISEKNLDHLFLALYDLICEKMALLSLEKVSFN